MGSCKAPRGFSGATYLDRLALARVHDLVHDLAVDFISTQALALAELRGGAALEEQRGAGI